MRETRTAALVAQQLQTAGFDVTTGVGTTGVVGLLTNGDGPVVMLRADMDALPGSEQTGLDYASSVDGVMHACGHDMHVAWLSGATAHLAAHRDAWQGTLMAVFQPAEETAAGAQAMIDDGLVRPFRQTRCRSRATRDAIAVRQHRDTTWRHHLRRRQFRDSRVRSRRTREVAPADSAVVTIGALQAGTKENVIPDEAVIKLNMRTFDENVRSHVLDAITRIVRAEADASGAPRPPEIKALDSYRLVRNDTDAATRVRDAFRVHFGEDRVVEIPPISASEDFGSFGTEWNVPSVFWTVGGTDRDAYSRAKGAGTLSELPTNHNPRFAPVLHPTIETGVETLVAATAASLGKM